MSVIQFPASTKFSHQPRELNELEARIWALRKKIYHVCYGMTRSSPALAEDLAMTSIQKAIAKQHLFRAEATLSTWVIAIARNVSFDYLRRNPEKGVTLVDLSHPDLRRVKADSPTPDEILQQNRKLELLDYGIARLPPELQNVFELYRSGWKLREISALLAVTEGTVKSRLNRGTLLLIKIVRRQQRQRFDS